VLKGSPKTCLSGWERGAVSDWALNVCESQRERLKAETHWNSGKEATDDMMLLSKPVRMMPVLRANAQLDTFGHLRMAWNTVGLSGGVVVDCGVSTADTCSTCALSLLLSVIMIASRELPSLSEGLRDGTSVRSLPLRKLSILYQGISSTGKNRRRHLSYDEKSRFSAAGACYLMMSLGSYHGPKPAAIMQHGT
jgi:hypothetical protein